MIFESRNSSARTSTPVHFDELYLRQLPPNVIEVICTDKYLLLVTFLKNRKIYGYLYKRKLKYVMYLLILLGTEWAQSKKSGHG